MKLRSLFESEEIEDEEDVTEKSPYEIKEWIMRCATFGRDKTLERILLADAESGPMTDKLHHLYLYARDVIKGRWPEAEEYIKTSPYTAWHYAYDILQTRWPEAESIILTDHRSIYWYTRYVLFDRWPEGEKELLRIAAEGAAYKDVIMKTLVNYASDVIKGRWPEAEEFINKDSWARTYYKRDVLDVYNKTT